MKKRLINQLVAFTQLNKELEDMTCGNCFELMLYQQDGSPNGVDDFLKEIVEIGKLQCELHPLWLKIKQYYNCELDVAILLYFFTDAYQFMLDDQDND